VLVVSHFLGEPDALLARPLPVAGGQGAEEERRAVLDARALQADAVVLVDGLASNDYEDFINDLITL